MQHLIQYPVFYMKVINLKRIMTATLRIVLKYPPDGICGGKAGGYLCASIK